jgi:hypothetical protein
MPFITFTIEGFQERISALSTIDAKIHQANDTIYREVSDFMVSEMRTNAHVSETTRTHAGGFMKSSIGSNITSTGAEVFVSAPYAVYENARGGIKAGYGPHNFADMAANKTQQIATQVVKREYDYIFQYL